MKDKADDLDVDEHAPEDFIINIGDIASEPSNDDEGFLVS